MKRKHYNQGKIEVIDVINQWKLNFNMGNVVKYIARSEYKEDRKSDLIKARNYLCYEMKYKTQKPISHEGMNIGEVLSDWKLKGNLYNAMVSIYTYIISGNVRVLETAKRSIEEELGGLK